MRPIKSLELFADERTEIFIDVMKDIEGQSIDLGAWLQRYGFDVIGAITFQRRFGFMEKLEDVWVCLPVLRMGYVMQEL